MTAFETGDYWGVYHLPVPYRKWMLRRYNKMQSSQKPQSSPGSNISRSQAPPTDRPLSQSERMKMMNQGAQSDPRSSMKAFTNGSTTKK